jgi:hypothetical protein
LIAITQDEKEILLQLLDWLPRRPHFQKYHDLAKTIRDRKEVAAPHIAIAHDGPPPDVYVATAPANVMIVDRRELPCPANPVSFLSPEKVNETLTYQFVEPDEAAMGKFQDEVVEAFKAAGVAF